MSYYPSGIQIHFFEYENRNFLEFFQSSFVLHPQHLVPFFLKLYLTKEPLKDNIYLYHKEVRMSSISLEALVNKFEILPEQAKNEVKNLKKKKINNGK